MLYDRDVADLLYALFLTSNLLYFTLFLERHHYPDDIRKYPLATVIP